MTINLDIGAEETQGPRPSRHLLNLKTGDSHEGGLTKREKLHKEASLDLKEEIKFQHKESGRICIVGERTREKQGLGRAPMILAALVLVLLLSAGQTMFLGKKEGGEALALASEAFVSLQGASQSFVSGEQGSDLLLFSEAQTLFEQAEEKGSFLLDYSSPWLSEPKEVESLRNILSAGGLMSEVGQNIAHARDSFTNLPAEGSLTDYLRQTSEDYLEPAAQDLDEIIALLDDVDLSGTGYEDKFYSYREKLNALSDVFDLWLAAKEPVLTALGDRYPQHYLVLLMNNDEMRLGGGFIGSFAIVEINDGRLEELDFHDVYEYDNRYFEDVPMPVHELLSLNTQWRMRDSNVSPDFPTSAKYAMQFLDWEGGPGVDGVIAINLSAAQGLLEETGPLMLASLSKSIDAETFPAVLSTLVEAKVSGQHSPKDILAELINSFIASMGTTETKAKLALRVLDESHKKQILFYHRDPHVEDLIKSMGMDASIPQLSSLTDSDFFMPTFTNIGGNKTDRYMQTKISHATEILADGTLVDHATITRTNIFNAATLAWLKTTAAQFGFTAWNGDLERVLGNDTNRAGVRLYIPEGSEILDVTGSAFRDELQFYYDKDLDASYYYLEQQIAPDSAASFTVTYSLPWTFRGEFPEYHFQLFKQPGLKSISYEKTVTAPDDIMLSSEPYATESRDDVDYTLTGKLDGDVEVKLLYR